ncbi:MAG: hypothetical protein ACREEB_13010 [Caulobacteraceae bacterium]
MRLAIISLVALSWAWNAQAGQTPAPPIRLTLAPTDQRLTLDQAHFQTGTIERPVEPRTAVDYRFGVDGPVASAGYLCGIGGIGPDSVAIPGGPASVYSHAGTFLGATLATPIK